MNVFTPNRERRPRARRRIAPALAAASVIVGAAALTAGSAAGQGLQEKLNSTQQKLSHAQAHEGVLTSQITPRVRRRSTA